MMDVKNTLKNEVKDIFMSNQNEMKKKVLAWAGKLESEKRKFQRER